jgi:ABC-type multidrug transport system fused ATPase/permease subunit
VSKFLRAFSILSPKAKRRMFLLFPVIIVGMALETLSIGMVLPALGILMSENYLEKFPVLIPLLDYLGNPSHKELIILGLSGLAGIYLIKNLFLFFQVQCQGTFVYSAQREISLNLFRIYLHRGYSFHLQTNSAKLIRNLTSEVLSYCSFFLMPCLNLLTETLVILAILSLLLWIEPQGTVFLVFILGVLVFLFVRATNKIVGKWGQKRLEAEEQKIKHLQQGFGGIKEILLSGRLEYFLRRYHHPNQVAGLMIKREYIFQYVPKLGVEVIAIFGLVSMCLYLIFQGKPHQEVTHMLGLMATAGFRMIPSFSRILNNLQSIRYGWASVDALTDEFNKSSSSSLSEQNLSDQNSQKSALSFEKEIIFSQTSFTYPESKNFVLDKVNFAIHKGEVVGVVGASGSGKSTLLNLLLGLFNPTSGAILIDGKELNPSNHKGWQKMIGYVPQEIYLLDDTIRRNIAFGLDDADINEDRVHDVLKMAQLDKFIQESDDGLNLLLGERGARLSGGQKQRIGIARALYHDPQLIVLDEATSALDEKTEKEILQMLEPMIGNKTFLMISHQKSSLSICSKIFRLTDRSIDII